MIGGDSGPDVPIISLSADEQRNTKLILVSITFEIRSLLPTKRSDITKILDSFRNEKERKKYD